MKHEEEKPRPPCRLGLTPGSGEKCRPGECVACGWHPSVDLQRKMQIRQNGLMKDPAGKKRLVLRKGRAAEA